MNSGLIIDLFAGGGGASLGLEAAVERPVDIALNHDPVALAAHKKNHPRTLHLEADIWKVKPRAATGGRKVWILWASPDCTHFSIAKGGKPVKKNIRSLAWAVVRWARDTSPDLIFLENVREFRGWGPLDDEGYPIKAQKGQSFQRWKRELERMGYVVDFRVLDASHYGAPTSRERLFLVARRDGQKIRWPEASHGDGGLFTKPLRTAAEIIDWSLECPSIFLSREEGKRIGVKRPLAANTMRRIAEGIKRFVLENPRPFIVGVGGRAGQSAPTGIHQPVGTITAKNDRAVVAPTLIKVNHATKGNESRAEAIDAPLSTVTAARRGHALVAPTLIQTGYGERKGQRPRYLDLNKPLGTVVADGQKHALCAAFISKAYGGKLTPGSNVLRPLDTITTQDHNNVVTADLGTPSENRAPQVRAFLTTYFGSKADIGQDLNDPLRTVTTRDRFGLVTVAGVEYAITDIGLRMLEPHELLRAQFGRFAETYDLSAARTKKAQVRLIGNSVCPEAAEAIVAANLPREQLREAA